MAAPVRPISARVEGRWEIKAHPHPQENGFFAITVSYTLKKLGSWIQSFQSKSCPSLRELLQVAVEGDSLYHNVVDLGPAESASGKERSWEQFSQFIHTQFERREKQQAEQPLDTKSPIQEENAQVTATMDSVTCTISYPKKPQKFSIAIVEVLTPKNAYFARVFCCDYREHEALAQKIANLACDRIEQVAWLFENIDVMERLCTFDRKFSEM